jgi:hypothetical protein
VPTNGNILWAIPVTYSAVHKLKLEIVLSNATRGICVYVCNPAFFMIVLSGVDRGFVTCQLPVQVVSQDAYTQNSETQIVLDSAGLSCQMKRRRRKIRGFIELFYY